MASRLEMDASHASVDGTWVGELGRRLMAALLVAAFLGAVLVSFVATDQRAVTDTSGTAGTAGTAGASITAPSEARSLLLAIEEVLTVSSADDSAALEDAWLSLTVVQERMAALAEVAAGTRPPLMGAPPPVPARARRDDALVRSAMTYVRGALETRDVRALERARELLEMART